MTASPTGDHLDRGCRGRRRVELEGRGCRGADVARLVAARARHLGILRIGARVVDGRSARCDAGELVRPLELDRQRLRVPPVHVGRPGRLREQWSAASSRNGSWPRPERGCPPCRCTPLRLRRTPSPAPHRSRRRCRMPSPRWRRCRRTRSQQASRTTRLRRAHGRATHRRGRRGVVLERQLRRSARVAGRIAAAARDDSRAGVRPGVGRSVAGRDPCGGVRDREGDADPVVVPPVRVGSAGGRDPRHLRRRRVTPDGDRHGHGLLLRRVVRAARHVRAGRVPRRDRLELAVGQRRARRCRPRDGDRRAGAREPADARAPVAGGTGPSSASALAGNASDASTSATTKPRALTSSRPCNPGDGHCQEAAAERDDREQHARERESAPIEAVARCLDDRSSDEGPDAVRKPSPQERPDSRLSLRRARVRRPGVRAGLERPAWWSGSRRRVPRRCRTARGASAGGTSVRAHD